MHATLTVVRGQPPTRQLGRPPARTPDFACECRAVNKPFHRLPVANLDESALERKTHDAAPWQRRQMSNERQHVGNANDIGGGMAMGNRCNGLPMSHVN